MSTDTETMDALVTESGRNTAARLAGSAILACQSDERLVELVRQGHERAFEAIVDRYRRPLVRFAGSILPASRTEDAVQQAFINAHAALRDSGEPVQLKAWLYTITRNASLNMLRQNGWNYEQIPDDFDGVLRPDQAVEQKIQLQRTVAAVNELPGRQRDAIVMRELEGRSYQEIALALGANDGAVRQLLNRARGTLRAVATAVMPPPIVARAATSLPPADGRRIAEVFGSFGAAGIVKVGAGAVVAGSLVVGAVKAPLPLTDHHASHQRATVSAAGTARAPSVSETILDPATQGRGDGSAVAGKHAAGNPARGHGKSQSRHATGAPAVQHHGRTGEREGGDDHGGTGPRADDRRSGSDDTRSGSTESHSGSNSGPGGGTDDSKRGSGGGGDDSTTSGSSGGSDDSPSSGSGSSGSGSDDVITSVTTESSSGSGSSGSGSSGSGSSGSGSSETSGSGSTDDSSGSSGSGSGTTTTDDH